MMQTINLDIEITRKFIVPGTSPEAISARKVEENLSIASRDDVSILINMTCQSVLSQILKFSQSPEAKQINPNVNPLITKAKYSKQVLDKTRESCEKLFPEIMTQPLSTQSDSFWNWLTHFLKSPI